MSPVLFLFLIRSLALGAAVEYRWQQNSYEMLASIVEDEPRSGSTPGVRALWRLGKGKNRITVNMASEGRLEWLGYRFLLRAERTELFETPRINPAFEVTCGKWLMSAGAIRGGLCGGLLLSEGIWVSAGAAVRHAWAGVPYGMRIGPVSGSVERPVAFSLRWLGKTEIAASVVKKGERDKFGIVEWNISRGFGTLLLISRDLRGAELLLGRRGKTLQWRFSAAGWSREGATPSYAVEVVFSGRSREMALETRLWSWRGERSPLAPPLFGITEARRDGIRFSAELRPPFPLRAAASVETAGRIGHALEGWWWRGEMELSGHSSKGAGWKLRFRDTGTMERENWNPRDIDLKRLLRLEVWSRLVGKIRCKGGLRTEEKGSGGRSDGYWLQMEYSYRTWNGYLRGTFSYPEPGIPLYWYEPGPIYCWNLRTDRARAVRWLIGARESPEGWHLQVIINDLKPAGFVAGWRSTW